MPELDLTIQGHVARITLNRPEVRNAFNDELIAALTQAFEAVGADPAVRAVVLAAEGPAFCAGADLNWMRRMAEYSREQNLADAGRLAAMLQAIFTCPKPTVARIQGDVMAGGVGLVAACDMAVSVEAAQFGLSEVRLGLAPSTISPYVIRAMGARAAHRYFLTAERFGAKEALRIGLVHAVVADAAALDAQVDAWVQALAAASPHAASACKALLHEVAGQPITPELVARTVQSIAELRASQQGREGVQAFLQKRKPAWQDDHV